MDILRKVTSGVVYPQVWTNYPRGLFREDKRVAAIENYKVCRKNGEPLPDLTPGWVKDMLSDQK